MSFTVLMSSHYSFFYVYRGCNRKLPIHEAPLESQTHSISAASCQRYRAEIRVRIPEEPERKQRSCKGRFRLGRKRLKGARSNSQDTNLAIYSDLHAWRWHTEICPGTFAHTAFRGQNAFSVKNEQVPYSFSTPQCIQKFVRLGKARRVKIK